MLYNKVEPRKEWLDAAIHGAAFLEKHGHDGALNWYFCLDHCRGCTRWWSPTTSSPTPSPPWLSGS